MAEFETEAPEEGKKGSKKGPIIALIAIIAAAIAGLMFWRSRSGSGDEEDDEDEDEI